MAGLVGVLKNGGGLGTDESYLYSFMHRSSCFPCQRCRLCSTHRKSCKPRHLVYSDQPLENVPRNFVIPCFRRTNVLLFSNNNKKNRFKCDFALNHLIKQKVTCRCCYSPASFGSAVLHVGFVLSFNQIITSGKFRFFKRENFVF